MRAPFGNQPTRPFWRSGAACLLICFGGSLILSANTTPGLRERHVAACYCHCPESSAHDSCVKLCDSPKYKARTWHPRCAKPRLHLPAENKDAGPRFPRPGRSERADNSGPASNTQQN